MSLNNKGGSIYVFGSRCFRSLALVVQHSNQDAIHLQRMIGQTASLLSRESRALSLSQYVIPSRLLPGLTGS